MLDPYRLIVINALLFSLVLVFFFVYKYVYPKKNIPPFLLVFVFSLLPLISLLRKGTYQSGDFSLHIYETMSFFDSLKDGIIIPRWGEELNATYGYPIHLFAYPLPRYIISLFVFVGFSFIASLKIFLALSFIASGISMYLFAKYNFGRFPGAVSAIFYLFAPYHLIDLHFRVAIGEVLSFVFIPLVFFGIQLLIQKITFKRFLFLSFSTAGIILSHQAISLATIALSIPFILVFNSSFKKKLVIFLTLIYGLLLSAFYWIPVIFEKQFTLPGLFHETVSFEKLTTLLYSPWRYGLLFQGPKGELGLIVGYTHIFVTLIILFFIYKNRIPKKVKRLSIFFLASFFLFIFFITNYSSFLWNLFPIAKDMQFTSRLLALIVFISSLLAGVFALSVKRKMFVYVIIFLAIASTILNWGNRTTISDIDDNWLRNNIPKSTAEGEGNGQSAPRWVDSKKIWMDEIPPKHIEIIDGVGEIKESLRSSAVHKYIINAKTDMTLKENTLYFPGWSVFIDGKKTHIYFQEKANPGVIHFNLNEGLHIITVVFEKTTPRIIGESVSLIALIFVGLICLIKVSRKLPKF